MAGTEYNFEREVLDRLIKIEGKLDSYPQTKEQVYENQRDIIKIQGDVEVNTKDIAGIKDNNKWLVRTVAGTVIGMVLELLYMVATQMGG